MIDLLELFRDLLPIANFNLAEYQRLYYTEIEHVTPEAVLVDGIWIPKSVMRCDPQGKLYVANWFYKKEILPR